jgi:MYXO-CTERM domain-containing protein
VYRGRVSSLLRLSVLMAIVALAPGSARACTTVFCERLDDLELAHPGPIPFGGAIALRPVPAPPNFGGGFSVEMATATTVTVTPKNGGEAVPGEVVAIADLELLAWRPGAPLMPATEYEVVVVVDNVGLDSPGCAPDGFERMFTITTTDSEAAALAVPAVTPGEMLTHEPVLRLDSAVCCGAAFPRLTPGDECIPPEVTFDNGFCAAGTALGRITVTASLDASAVAAAQGQIGHTFDGQRFALGASEAVLVRAEPFCAPLVAIHLMTGEEMLGPEVCVGQELADQLGAVAIDPSPELEKCVSPPYTCELDASGTQWDSMNCAPWPEGQATTGGEDSTDGATGEATTGEAPATGTGGGSGTGEGTGGDASAGGGGEVGDKGCGCASGEGAAPWGVLVIAGLLRRRRRAEVT